MVVYNGLIQYFVSIFMNIGFYIDEMNYRGVANSTFFYSSYNQKILKNKSIIFYNKTNQNNKSDIIKKFKKKFITIGVKNFNEIENYKNKLKLSFIYVQKGGERNEWVSNKIKTLVHCVYPQKLNEIHGFKYIYISEWLSKNFSKSEIPFVPLILEQKKINGNLKKKLKIKKKQLVFGCHGGQSSFDLKFVRDTVFKLVNTKKDVTFVFLNIKKFCNHPRIIFLKGSSNDIFKKKFINTCDAMIYGRSLGESFGLACGEFSVQGKKIISYRFNKHRSHLLNISNGNFVEYASRNELNRILTNFSKVKSNTKNKYHSFKATTVMRIFKKEFLDNKSEIKLSLSSYIYNFISFSIMNYRYLRHKLYNHYYNIFESKFIYKEKN